MGQAKRRKAEIDNYAPGQCNGCNLCCVIPTIPEIGKKSFTRCGNLCSVGCSLHGSDAKPRICVEFDCTYITAHKLGLAQRDLIPHPKEAGAYLAHPERQKAVVLYVDPRQPRKWQSSSLMKRYLKGLVAAGYKVAILDRGYQFETTTAKGVDDMASMDLAAVAEAQGLERITHYPG